MARPSQLIVGHQGGDRFMIEIGPHKLAVDQPLDIGGTDTAPTPTELFIGSFAACVAFYARRFLHRHGLDENVGVTARWETADRPHRVASIVLEIGGAVPAELQDRFLTVARSCTIGNTLGNAPEISIVVAPLHNESAIEVA